MARRKSVFLWIKRIFLLTFFLVAITAAVATYYWFQFQAWLQTPLTIPQNGFTYQLDVGKSLNFLSQDLAKQNVLTHPKWLVFFARYYDKAKIHPGEYLLDEGLTPESLLEKLNKGEVILHQVTFLEGWNFRQIMHALDENNFLTHKLSQKTTEEKIAALKLPIDYPEGWFFPDTYKFAKGASDVEILSLAYKATRKNLDELWASRDENLPYANDYQALIMASIVEKETGSSSERQQIAGVFVRRLQQGMKLQTDPTVIYGMGEAYAGNITKSDLQRATPYNTYIITGLPPTPIASPGKAALYASLHPDKSHAIYFVAKGDGTSIFSDNLADHQRAVARYQLHRAEDYRSH